VLLFVEKNAARRIKLFAEIKINDVTGQHHASVLARGCEQQSVIQGAPPMGQK
jgi:hypothetical protein